MTGYTSVVIHSNSARIILDYKNWSLILWKRKAKSWEWGLDQFRNLNLGPFQINRRKPLYDYKLWIDDGEG